MAQLLDQFLQEIDDTPRMVISSARDYPADWSVAPHAHKKHQLIYALRGVMVVRSGRHQWTVPPSRGIWIPSGQVHAIRYVGTVQMRSLYVRPDDLGLPDDFRAVSISPLLHELIQAALALTEPYLPDSRAARLIGLILDELKLLPTLPLHLPHPPDPRIQVICSTLQDDPADSSTLADWGSRLGLDEKTIQRLFQKGTGMTFGQWRQQARLLLALERIALGEKIIDVAGELGYDSPSAFSNMFKKQFGSTPSRFFR